MHSRTVDVYFFWGTSVRILCDELAPANLVVYGSGAYGVLDYPREQGIPVHLFPADTYARSKARRAAA